MRAIFEQQCRRDGIPPLNIRTHRHPFDRSHVASRRAAELISAVFRMPSMQDSPSHGRVAGARYLISIKIRRSWPQFWATRSCQITEAAWSRESCMIGAMTLHCSRSLQAANSSSFVNDRFLGAPATRPCAVSNGNPYDWGPDASLFPFASGCEFVLIRQCSLFWHPSHLPHTPVRAGCSRLSPPSTRFT